MFFWIDKKGKCLVALISRVKPNTLACRMESSSSDGDDDYSISHMIAMANICHPICCLIPFSECMSRVDYVAMA